MSEWFEIPKVFIVAGITLILANILGLVKGGYGYLVCNRWDGMGYACYSNWGTSNKRGYEVD